MASGVSRSVVVTPTDGSDARACFKPERNEDGRAKRDEKQRIMGQPFGEGVPFGDVRAMRNAGGTNSRKSKSNPMRWT